MHHIWRFQDFCDCQCLYSGEYNLFAYDHLYQGHFNWLCYVFARSRKGSQRNTYGDDQEALQQKISPPMTQKQERTTIYDIALNTVRLFSHVRRNVK